MQMRVVCEALQRFWRDHGQLPSNEVGLRDLVEENRLQRTFLFDSWQRKIQYEVRDTKGAERLRLQGDGGPDVSLDCDVN